MSGKVYKIRNKRTGLFSTGGSSPRWSEKGKAWSGIGYLKSHLALIESEAKRGYRWTGKKLGVYADAEIVTFEFVENASKDVSVALEEYKAEKSQREAKKRAKAEAARQKWEAEEALRKEAAEREQLKKLRAKYPDE